ncbi:MAG: hypothetical protein IJS12_01920 [Lachnospiraceae bacterium]|nr:hypothetical protein [Lachnospiraceae bacterium]
MSFSVFDMLVIACGLYMAYCAVMMKTKGRINSGVVMSRSLDESMLKDKQGFIDYLWWKLLIVGLLCAASGIFNILFTKYAQDSTAYLVVQLIINGVFFALLIVYGLIVVKAQKKYMK